MIVNNYAVIPMPALRLTVGMALFGIGLVTLAVILLLAASNATFPSWHGWDGFQDDLADLVDPTEHVVALSELAGGDVVRACWMFEYGDVLPGAVSRGVPLAGVPDIMVGENHFGLLMAGAETTSYVEFSMYQVDQDAAYAWGDCVTGSHLAIQFDTLDPLTGGQIVDLDAPDLRPTVVDL